ncbi:MAG TPA: pyridoxal-phosphate dependent enzyme [Bacteroidales bacterium]|nr:pyridoxal-phosphate dependent enzyme [Bacteroidales bacterium]
MLAVPSFQDIQKAHLRIKKLIHDTPVLTSSGINQLTGSVLYFKCENFQKAGAFKFRGAANALFSLDEKSASRGVATHSSGNHAAALALAAGLRGVKCFVVMPHNASKVKVEAVKSYGARVTFCEPTLQSRELTLQKMIDKNGAVFIHPYNNFEVICGQGTAAIEFLREVPDLEMMMTPVGGGGLFSGTLISARAIHPEMKLYGAEPKNADDAYRSFKSKRLMPSVKPDTIADGLLTSLSELTFKIITEKADDIFTVSEDTIIEAMKLIWERMKIVVEPSAAVPLGVVLENKAFFRGRKTGLILSGGNVDVKKLPFQAG